MSARFGGRLVHMRMPLGMTTAQRIAYLEKLPQVAYADFAVKAGLPGPGREASLNLADCSALRGRGS